MIITAIYFIGYICAYMYTRFNTKREYGQWTKGDRTFTILYSLGSWCTFIAMAILHALSFDFFNNDEKANW